MRKPIYLAGVGALLVLGAVGQTLADEGRPRSSVLEASVVEALATSDQDFLAEVDGLLAHRNDELVACIPEFLWKRVAVLEAQLAEKELELSELELAHCRELSLLEEQALVGEGGSDDDPSAPAREVGVAGRLSQIAIRSVEELLAVCRPAIESSRVSVEGLLAWSGLQTLVEPLVQRAESIASPAQAQLRVECSGEISVSESIARLRAALTESFDLSLSRLLDRRSAETLEVVERIVFEHCDISKDPRFAMPVQQTGEPPLLAHSDEDAHTDDSVSTASASESEEIPESSSPISESVEAELPVDVVTVSADTDESVLTEAAALDTPEDRSDETQAASEEGWRFVEELLDVDRSDPTVGRLPAFLAECFATQSAREASRREQEPKDAAP